MSGLSLRVATWVSNTEAEGPGVRFALWVQGCSIRCKDCTNPGMFTAQSGRGLTLDEVVALVNVARQKEPALEGVSILGGEPLDQDAPLAELVKMIHDVRLSVMVYTGYDFESERVQSSRVVRSGCVDLLKTGPYVESLRTTGRRWIGSTNQELHFLTERYSPDDPLFSQPNHAEIRLTGDGEITVVGFPFESVVKSFPNRRMQ